MNTDITAVLMAVQSADQAVRTQAEEHLRQFKVQNAAMFLVTLCEELKNNDKSEQTRVQAGIYLKNSLDAKDQQQKMEMTQNWLALEPEKKQQIKGGVLAALMTPSRKAGTTAAQVVGKIAAIEVPRNEWPELVPALCDSITKPQAGDPNLVLNLRLASLEALGFTCEELVNQNLQSHLSAASNHILTALIYGMRAEEPPQVRQAGVTALYNAMEFVESNMEKENERNVIMQSVCETTQCTDVHVRVAAYECLIKIAEEYYQYLDAYIQTIFNLTFNSIKTDDESVGRNAVEFWSSVADMEIEILEDEEDGGLEPGQASENKNFTKKCLPFLVPMLTEQLLRQEEDQDEDTWNVATAAGLCLSQVSQCTRNEVIPHVMPFIQANIQSENWHHREGAILAFGCILDGPDSNALAGLVYQGLPLLLHTIKDPYSIVRDSTAWTIAKICEHHADAVVNPPAPQPSFLPNLLQRLVEGLTDEPRVAANICFAIHNLGSAFTDELNQDSTYVLSPYFMNLCQVLLTTTDREDSDSNNLRSSAYESLNTLISHCTTDCYASVEMVLKVALDKLEKTFAMQVANNGDREQQNELQALLCSAMQIITQKLDAALPEHYCNRMMQDYLTVLGQGKNSTVHEEALMAVGAMAQATGPKFEQYAPHFMPFLKIGLSNFQEAHVCFVAVGVVSDCCRAIEEKMLVYCDEIVHFLLQDLQNPLIKRDVKPAILSTFADVALAIKDQFIRYLPAVMSMLSQAAQTQVDGKDADMVDYLNQLRAAIFEAFTGIVQGLRVEGQAHPFAPYVDSVMMFVEHVTNDMNRTDEVTSSAVSLLGDMAMALRNEMVAHRNKPYVQHLLTVASNSTSEETVKQAKWALLELGKA